MIEHTLTPQIIIVLFVDYNLPTYHNIGPYRKAGKDKADGDQGICRHLSLVRSSHFNRYAQINRSEVSTCMMVDISRKAATAMNMTGMTSGALCNKNQ